MSTESDMDNCAILTLHKYNVKITIDRNVQQNRGYVFTPSVIDASPVECALFQLAIKLMVDALYRHPNYIYYFE